MEPMSEITHAVAERGDLAHLALFVWGVVASGAAFLLLRELAAANRRFDDFVRELARFNRRFGQD